MFYILMSWTSHHASPCHIRFDSRFESQFRAKKRSIREGSVTCLVTSYCRRQGAWNRMHEPLFLAESVSCICIRVCKGYVHMLLLSYIPWVCLVIYRHFWCKQQIRRNRNELMHGISKGNPCTLMYSETDYEPEHR